MSSPRAMPPRLHLCTQCLNRLHNTRTPLPKYLSTASAIIPAPPIHQTISSLTSTCPLSPTQPPSHKPPEFRKSQLHRQYTSLLRSTPLLLLFQHNNLKATEWMSIRRELYSALQKTDETLFTDLAPRIKVQAIQAGIFESALLVTEYYHPSQQINPTASTPHPTDPSIQSSATVANTTSNPADPTLTHSLSTHAHTPSPPPQKPTPSAPSSSGPLAIVSFPNRLPNNICAPRSPSLSPKAPTFAAPTRRANPGYHDASVQAGLQKLLLLGARVEGRVFDTEETRWVGGIEGGLDGLRGQLVQILGSLGAGVRRRWRVRGGLCG
ncbi:hypothetical protein ABVK25_003589 [Lepraria finkii]|uniref:Uncharacterized protein n=1 Tax=Lepraria finkii TaxID=1340010 RepID=A0ABR4BDM3_9LECA